MCESVSLKI